MTDRQAHWQTVYATKGDDRVSWFEETPALSIRLIEQATAKRGSAIDTGGGASRLPVARHDGKSLSAIFGEGVTLLSEHRHDHLTPAGAIQHFQFSTFRKI